MCIFMLSLLVASTIPTLIEWLFCLSWSAERQRTSLLAVPIQRISSRSATTMILQSEFISSDFHLGDGWIEYLAIVRPGFQSSRPATPGSRMAIASPPQEYRRAMKLFKGAADAENSRVAISYSWITTFNFNISAKVQYSVGPRPFNPRDRISTQRSRS